MDTAGNLYGTTAAGGDRNCEPPEGCGVVFKLSRAGRIKVLHTFRGGSDGAVPYGGVILDAEGNLYGTTVYGGTGSCADPYPGCGVVFKVDSASKETILHTFTGGADGANPHAALIRDARGRLYGTTESGGKVKTCDCSDCNPGCGVVFRITSP